MCFPVIHPHSFCKLILSCDDNLAYLLLSVRIRHMLDQSGSFVVSLAGT